MRFYRLKDNSLQSISNDHRPAGAVEMTEAEFNAAIDALPKPEPPPVIDRKAQYAAASSAAAKVDVIAEVLGLK